MIRLETREALPGPSEPDKNEGYSYEGNFRCVAKYHVALVASGLGKAAVSISPKLLPESVKSRSAAALVKVFLDLVS